tara:strand:+ start:486 stop:716 length:231 start_codon:yes stop_codon:yes gene_type:complete
MNIQQQLERGFLVIHQQFKGEGDKKIVDLDRFLDLTEGNGWWKKGTALQELKNNRKVWTPYSIFTLCDSVRTVQYN